MQSPLSIVGSTRMSDIDEAVFSPAEEEKFWTGRSIQRTTPFGLTLGANVRPDLTSGYRCL